MHIDAIVDVRPRQHSRHCVDQHSQMYPVTIGGGRSKSEVTRHLLVVVVGIIIIRNMFIYFVDL